MGGRCEEPGSPEEPWPPEQLSQAPDQSRKSRLDSGQKRSATPDIRQGGESKQQQPLAALILRAPPALVGVNRSIWPPERWMHPHRHHQPAAVIKQLLASSQLANDANGQRRSQRAVITLMRPQSAR